MRRTGAAAAERAGVIASRNGSASEAPSPRSTVRRGNDFLVMIMVPLSSAEKNPCAGAAP